MYEKIYLIEQDQLDRLYAISAALHSRSDRERDFGHKLWLVCNDIKEQEINEEQLNGNP